jgi:arylsulfatase A-like enzyme
MPEDEPSFALYKDKDWDAGYQKSENDAQKYAAMVNMIDRQIGEIFELLAELGLEDDTIVFVSGDQGGQHYFETDKYPEGFFEPNGGVFRGEKRDLYEGGLRIPMVVKWPGRIKVGVVSDQLWYFADVMPTLAELAGGEVPASCDGISVVPTLLDKGRQEQHEFIYWEYTGSRAVRMGNWKAICPGKRDNKQIRKTGDDGRLEIVYEWSAEPWELYDLNTDLGERNNIADKHPGILEKMIAFAKGQHSRNYQGMILDPSLSYKKES